MMESVLRLLLFVVTAGLGSADVDVPSVTPPSFSQIVGKYRISSSASPTEVQVEEPITLKVQITGQGPDKYQPARAHLQIFPDDLAENFYLEDAPQEDRLLPERKLWEFVFRLRPKHASVKAVPGLRLLYFAPGPGRFQSSFADEIPIKVRPRPEASAEKLELKVVQAPARFYELRPAEEVLRDDTPQALPGLVLVALLLAAPPLVCFLWYYAWRRLHPSAAEHRQRRRSRAARLALAYLECQQDEDGARSRAAAVDYLRHRLDLQVVEATPAEVACHFKRLGFSKKLAADWAAFLDACDQARFAPAPGAPRVSLNAEAMRLIHEVEADPCVRHQA